jgi:hypothetical protein
MAMPSLLLCCCCVAAVLLLLLLLPCCAPLRPARYAPLFGNRQYRPNLERAAPSIEEQVSRLAGTCLEA